MSDGAESQNREPWLAVCFSTILPGLGQVYAGATDRGIVLLCLVTALTSLGVWQILAATGSVMVGAILLVLTLALCVFGFFDAHKCARVRNAEAFEGERKSKKNQWLAVFLSRLMPGLGHVYLRKWNMGILYAILLVAGAVAVSELKRRAGFRPTGNIVMDSLLALYGPYVCFSAYSVLRSSRPTLRTATKVFFALMAGTAVLYVVAERLVVEHVVQTLRVPTNSMRPTLMGRDDGPLGGDMIVCNKLSYWSRAPRRGDIVVFVTRSTTGSGGNTYRVSRLVGIPGDTISIDPPFVLVDDKRLLQPPVFSAIATGKGGHSGFFLPPCRDGTSPLAEGREMTLAEGEYVVLGDNGRYSRDSRYFGPVLRKAIVGRVAKIYWPPRRAGRLE